MTAGAPRRVFAGMMHKHDGRAGFVTEAVEVANDSAHILTAVFVSAGQDARKCVDDDKPDRHSELSSSRSDHENEPLEISVIAAKVDRRGYRRKRHQLGKFDF